jgi:integrase
MVRPILLMERTGVREGEALALKVHDVDFDERRIHVERTWNSARRGEGLRFNSTKSGEERWVDMSLQLKDALLEHLARYPSPDGWLFSHKGGLPFHPTGLYRVWRKFFKSQTSQLIRYRKPHALRHTFASLLISQGKSLAYVRDQLGHSSIRITVDTYSHFIRGESKRAVDDLDDRPAQAEKRKLYASEGIHHLSLIRGGQT